MESLSGKIHEKVYQGQCVKIMTVVLGITSDSNILSLQSTSNYDSKTYCVLKVLNFFKVYPALRIK